MYLLARNCNIHSRACLGYGDRMDPHALDEAVMNDAVAARLAMIREVVSLSQVEFAGRADILPNAWNNYERGRSRIGIEAAIRLVAVYQVTLDYIYLGDTSNLPYRMAHAIEALRQARGTI